MSKKNEMIRVQIMVIDGHNVLVETKWIKINGKFEYVGMQTIQVLD